MWPWVEFRGRDRFGIHDAVSPTWDGVHGGFIFWSRHEGIESRFSFYAGLFCLNRSLIPGYA